MNRVIALSLVPLALSACGGNNLGTGAKLSVDYFGDTDVVGYAFEIVESADVECTLTGQGLEDQTVFVDLVDGIFPGMIDHIEDHFDPATRHLGADLFASMDPGCYNITATPLKKVPTSVSDFETTPGDYVTAACSTAKLVGINVEEGKTTEVELFSQCEGDGAGALDSLVLINNPPTLVVDSFEKFAYECEITRVCATGYDVNDDPVEFVWSKDSGTGSTKGDGKDYNINDVSGYPKIIDMEDGHRVWQDCKDVWVKYTDSHEFSATIYDLDADGDRIEDRSDVEESSFSLAFPWHVNWIEYPMCFDSTGSLVEADGVDIDLPATSVCAPTDAETFYCNRSNTYGVSSDVRAHLCVDDDSDGYKDELDESALYPECD